jgi:hypothetical protein
MPKNVRAAGSVENIVQRLARWSNMKNVPLEKGNTMEVLSLSFLGERE